MKIIIIILQAILNLVRKRRDLIANRSKIPPEYRDDVVVWYSPKKQKLTNYDVIESYAEDFTYWTINNIAITSAEKKIVIPAGTELKYVIAFRGFNSFTAGFDIKYTGNAVIRYKYNKEDGTEDNITINKSGIYHLPASVRAQKNFGFYCNPQTVTEEATIEQLPTSILKDFSGNGLDAYMYGFTGKLNSGVGIYKEDFSTYTKNNQAILNDISPNKFIINEVLGANGFLYTGKMTSNPITIQVDGEFNGVSFRYLYGNSGNKFVVITEPGTYELPASDGSTSNNGFFGTEQVGKCNIVVTQIPDYPNSLCYAGKQYCQAYNLPKFTDYTIIIRRAILSLNGSFGLISKRISPKQLGAFIFEKDNNVAGAERNTLRAFSFMTSTAVNPNLDYSITYQTKNKYNGQDLTVGSTVDSDVFLIGAGLYNEANGVGEFMRNGFDVINANANKNAFDLYKYSRDNKDELMGQIGEMKTELAVLKATRPYQDALIQCDIRRVAEHADFNLWRRTCRMISGEVVLPNTPTVTGYASYNPCACPATTPAPTTAA